MSSNNTTPRACVKTPWFRMCGKKYCRSESHHDLSNLALCVTQPKPKPQPQPVLAGKRPKSRINGIHLKYLLYNQVIHTKILE